MKSLIEEIDQALANCYPQEDDMSAVIKTMFREVSHYGTKHPVRLRALIRTIDSDRIYWGASGQKVKQTITQGLKSLNGRYTVSFDEVLAACSNGADEGTCTPKAL